MTPTAGTEQKKSANFEREEGASHALADRTEEAARTPNDLDEVFSSWSNYAIQNVA